MSRPPLRLALAVTAGVMISSVAVSNGADDGCKPSAAGRAFRNLPAPYAPSANTAIVHTRIAGQNFYVPRNYFRHPQIGCGVEEPGMLLRVLLPDMEGYSEANAREIEGLDRPGWGRKMNILVQALGRLSGFTRPIFHAHTGGVDPAAKYSTQFGLLHTPSNRIESGGPRTATDVFFKREDGNVIRFIVCDATSAVPSPSCAHRFLYRGLEIKATYSREHLAVWVEIETKIRALLDRFGIPSPG